MTRIEKTVFISYRRTNLPWALAIYQNLTMNGYDVFFDYQSINSGDFERVILENIRARAHFIVLLTPSALERCDNPEDWLRREIETAIEEKRNVIPLFLEGFSFNSPTIAKYLTGKLEKIKYYNGLNLPADYFDEALKRLRDRFLNVSLDAITHPVSSEAKNIALQQKVAADQASAVDPKELSSQEWLEKGKVEFRLDNYTSALQAYSEAIRLNPNLVEGYHYRAITKTTIGDVDGAMLDLQKSLQLKPTSVSVKENIKVKEQSEVNIVGDRNIIGDQNIVQNITLKDSTKAAEIFAELLTNVKNRRTSVFLSHASQDKPLVREFYKRLIADGYDAWLDEEKLLPGQDWEIEIEKAINKTDVVIIFLSKNSVTRDGYIQKELRSILYRAEYKPEGTIFIIPVRLDSTEIPHRFSKYQYIQCSTQARIDWAYEHILKSLRQIPETQKTLRDKKRRNPTQD